MEIKFHHSSANSGPHVKILFYLPSEITKKEAKSHSFLLLFIIYILLYSSAKCSVEVYLSI
jgi:hypothetical protein